MTPSKPVAQTDVNRRAFLKAVSLSAAGMQMLSEGAARIAAAEIGDAGGQIKNKTYRVRGDIDSGLLDVWYRDQPFLVNAGWHAVTAEGTIALRDRRYQRTAGLAAVTDELGQGQRMTMRCRDERVRLDFELRATLYEERSALVLDVICRNVSERDISLKSMELRAVPDEKGGCRWPGVKSVLTNGKMYYDAGRVARFPTFEPIDSWFNIGFSRGDREPGLVVGYLEQKTGLGMLRIGRAATPSAPDAISLVARCTYADGFILRPGRSVTSDRLMFHVGPDPFTALEAYAQCMGDVHQIRLNPIVNGWCSWSYAYEAITEKEVLRQAEFAAQHLKPYGFEYMQVDDGFYRGFGDWEGNEKFPHGMKWLADRVRELGLRPGIWFAPYIIAEGTEVYEKHPDWLIHNADGKLKQVGPGLVEGSEDAKNQKPKRYALDITHPDAAAWFRRLFETAAHDWGYEFIKIDFVDWSVLAADQYYDRSMTRAAVYRRGFQIMREAVGPKVHLLDCGPGQVSAGLLDSMRIELDQPPVNWNQYFLQSASSAPAAGKRYYFHKRTWINDDDHIVLAPLAVPQAQAVATLIALTGGATISGDRMSDLDTNRLDILRKVYPSYGEAARPVDLFEGDRPEVFALPVKKSFGEWLVLGLFNSDEKNPVNKKIALERLRLDPKRAYVAFDFWNQRFFGELRGEFQTRLEPGSVRLLAIHEKRAHPFVISTDRHVIQGGLELESAMWDEATSTINGVSLGPVGSTHNVYIYLPDAHKWVQGHPFFFYDYPHYTLKMMEPNILRVQVRFDESQRVAWKINMRQFFAPS